MKTIVSKTAKETFKTIALTAIVAAIVGFALGFYANDRFQARYDKAPVVQVVSPEVSK